MKSFLPIIFLFFLVNCGIPSLVRSPLELLSFLRMFGRAGGSTGLSLGGAVSGLPTSSSLAIKNGADTVSVSADGNFSFPTKFRTGDNFDVSFTLTSPTGVTCTLANGKGTVQTSDITNVSITCGWGAGYYEVGVSITGITGTLTVQNNASDTQSITAAGLTKFPVRIQTGSSYSVTISSQSTGSVCAFVDPTLTIGNIATANVSLFVTCTMGFLSGGTIQSVASADLGVNLISQNPYLKTLVGSYPFNVVGGGGPIASAAGFPVDGAAPSARFNNPGALVSDGTFVYVADYGNNVIRKINKTTGMTSTFAGGNLGGGVICPGAFPANCKDGIGADAQFNGPYGLTTDGTNLYVLEFLGSRIRKINLATADVSTLAGTGAAAFSDNSNGILAAFSNPHWITLYEGMLYVADRYNERIRVINPVTSAVNTLAGSVQGYTDAIGSGARFFHPIGIVGLGGFLYVTDHGNSLIRKISLSGANSVTTVAGILDTSLPYQSIDGYGQLAEFDSPFGITSDGTNLFITEYSTYKIRHLRLLDGKVTTLVGGNGYADNSGTNGLMGQPGFLTTDGVNVYLSDSSNHAIRRLESSELARYTMDGNANDSVGTKHLTPTGAPLPTLVSDENGVSSGGYELDGGSQYLSSAIVPTSAIDNMTISLWIFNRGSAGAQYPFYNGVALDGYGLVINSGTNIVDIKCPGPSTFNGAGLAIPLNTWTHLALVRLKPTAAVGIWQLYKNGISQTVAGGAGCVPTAPTATNFSIGSLAGASFLKGKVSDARVFQGALDPTAIQKLAIQVPSGLVAYYPMSGNTNDVSGNENHATTIFGTPTVTMDRFGNTASAYNFNGASSMEKTFPYGLPTGNAARTYCAWVRSTSPAIVAILSFGGTAASIGSGLMLNATNILNFGVSDDVTASHFNAQNRWVHICGTHNGMTTASLYYNGAFQTQGTVSWNTSATTSPGFRISSTMSGGNYFIGDIDDVRVYNRELTAAEIKAISGSHPLQVSGLQLHLQADSLNASPVSNWADTSPNNTTAGNATTDGNSVVAPGAQPTWSANSFNGKPAVVFNGTTQYLQNAIGPYPGLMSSLFSYFIVMKRTSTAGIQTVSFIGPVANGKQIYFDDPAGSVSGTISSFNLHASGLGTRAISSTPFSVLGTGMILSMSYDSGSLIPFPFFSDFNGSIGSETLASAFTSPSVGNGVYIGASHGGGGQFASAEISEIIYYNTVLSTADRNLVHCYLSSKYSIKIPNTCP